MLSQSFYLNVFRNFLEFVVWSAFKSNNKSGKFIKIYWIECFLKIFVDFADFTDSADFASTLHQS